jgi:hypothetical protein
MKKMIFMVAMLVMTACHKKSEMDMSGGVLPVEVALPVVQDITLTREYPGYLAADATIPVVGRVNGTVVKRKFVEGGRVKEGDLLFVIEPTLYENAVAQELVAHGLEPYYYNSKKRGELDFVIEQGGKVLPIEVKSGKDYTYHRALSNIMDCGEYDLPEALVLNNDNLSVDGRITYVPVYMVMFLEKGDTALIEYKVDLGGLSNG